jgi:hypothetical protein
MKKTFLSGLALLALLATPLARAWTYNDGDLLLIFRESGQNDIEFDLGSVSNLLGHANGYTTPITGWDASLVTSKFGTDLTGASVILLATTSKTSASPIAWLSSDDPNVNAYRDSLSDWTTSLYGIINAIGNKPVVPVPITPTETNAYSINPANKAAYDYLVSGGTAAGANAIPQLGGNVKFTVEQIIPGQLDFWAIQPTNTANVPDTLVGTFTIATNGTLTFIAGSRQSTISAVTRIGNVSAIQFTTTVGNTYSVAYTNKLGGITAAWPVAAGTLIGDGNTDTIYHTNSGAAEFYRINTQ